MKKKIILGLLFLVLFLFFMTTSWALDYDSYLKSRHQEHPEQGVQSVPVIPQTTDPSPSMIKFIFVPAGQNLPVLIFFNKSSTQSKLRVQDSTKNSTISLNKTK